MFGNYSQDSIKKISSKRTEEARDLVQNYGGEIKSGYALLGNIDIVLIVELPDADQAMKTSVALSKMLGVSFTTAPAVSMDGFDKLMEGI